MSKQENKESLEPAAWGDEKGLGLLGRSDELDEIFETGERPKEKDVSSGKPEPEANDDFEKEINEEQEQEAIKKDDSKPEPEKETTEKPNNEETSEDNNDDVDDELKGLGEDFFNEDDDSEKGFDENSYDAQTNRILKEMKEAGHPGEAFKSLREENKSLIKQVNEGVIPVETQRKLDELQLKAEEAEGLRERIQEISKKDAQLSLESSDEYQNEVLTPVGKIMDNVKDLSESYRVDIEVLNQIIKTPDLKEREALIRENRGDESTAGLGVVGSNEISRLAADFSKLRDKRHNMLSEASERVERQRADDITQTKAQLEEHRQSVQTMQSDYWDNYKEVIPGLVDDNGKETGEFQKLRSRSAAIDFSNARAKDQAYASFAGVLLPYAMKQMKETEKRLAQYEKGSQRKKNSRPGPGESVGKKQGATPDKSNEGKRTLLEDMAEQDFVS